MLQDPQKKLHQLENKLNEWIPTGVEAPFYGRGAYQFLPRGKEERNMFSLKSRLRIIIVFIFF